MKLQKGSRSEQTQKEVRPQEVNSLVHTPRNDEPASGNRLRECIQNFETLEKEIQFTRVCENATNSMEFLLECASKLLLM